jgi:primosomal protein N' (replication factor Y)
VLSAFSNHEADILIGTQMIVKGHDFPNVTLVGVLAADMSLYAGDYRAAERTFQLLTQAAGRAGRGKKKGEVVIQTYTPDNYSIRTAAKQDYKAFYEEEIAYRQLLGYPPVSNMLMITFASKSEEKLNAVSAIMQKKIALIHEEDVTILGPVDAQVYKLKDYYNKLIYVRYGSYEKLTIFKDWLEGYAGDNALFKNINIQYEFN